MDTASNDLFNKSEEAGVNLMKFIEELDDLTEQLWHELGGKVSRQRVCEVVVETAAEFHGATVTQYIPLLVRRQAGEKLAQEIG